MATGAFFLLVLVAFILAQAQRARWKERELVGKRMAQRKLGRTSIAIAGKIPVPTAVKIRMRARVHAFLILHWPFPERIKRGKIACTVFAITAHARVIL